jgi:hypothetical protein
MRLSVRILVVGLIFIFSAIFVNITPKAEVSASIGVTATVVKPFGLKETGDNPAAGDSSEFIYDIDTGSRHLSLRIPENMSASCLIEDYSGNSRELKIDSGALPKEADLSGIKQVTLIYLENF